MNKLKKFFTCSTLILLPMCVYAATSAEDTGFTDMHGANKRFTNNSLVNVYDRGDTLYNELNLDTILKGKDLKLLGTNYTATLNTEVLDDVDFVSELGLGYRRISSTHNDIKTNFNVADAGLKMYLSYNISESKSVRNAFNFGALGHDAITFKTNGKFDFNEIDTALFAQYYLRAKFGVFKTENSATVAYNYNFIRNMKDAKDAKLLDKHSENYFDALLKTKAGLEFETNVLDIKAFFVASYNARLNKRNNDVIAIKDEKNITFEYKDKLNIGLEGEVVAGIFGIKLNADYDLIRKDFYYGVNANLKF